VALKRIVVVGTTGSGKTTLARRLAEGLGSKHVELDALSWGPNWTMRPPEEFLALVAEATEGNTWVACGNYSRSRPLLWSRADTVVWLDYPLVVVLWRLWWRTLKRSIRQEELWQGNKESLWRHFCSRDSLFLWALQSYGRRRREYPALFGEAQYAHIEVIRHRWPGDTERWLEQVIGR